MAVHIRHGAPGSFKTASAIWFDLVEWLKDGRTVYTNVRDVQDLETIAKVVGCTFPDSAEVVSIDTDSESARYQFATWFHWLPYGAAIIIDEAQFIYPSNRKDFKPENLDFPNGEDAAHVAKRPPDIFTAIDKHRHFNWDVCLTTPSIKKLPNWLRDTCETAYHHKNMSHIPFFNRKCRIHRHDPSSTGTAITKQSQYEFKKIPVGVHDIYGSTITGVHTTNRAESNPLKNPRVVSLIMVGIGSLAFSVIMALQYFDPSDPAPIENSISKNDAQITIVDNSGSNSKNVRQINRDDVRKPDYILSDFGAYLAPFFSDIDSIYISAFMNNIDGINYSVYAFVSRNGIYSVTDKDLRVRGFITKSISNCIHEIAHDVLPAPIRVFCGRAEFVGASLAPENEATTANVYKTPNLMEKNIF